MIAAYNGDTNAITQRFVPSDWIDERVVSFQGSTVANVNWASLDERGSVLNTQNTSGGVIGINNYDAYGMPGPGNIGRFGYTGQMWLPDAQAWHYKARAYHPGLGRFLQTDPIGYSGGLNIYAYVGGDVVNLVDPWGLIPLVVGGTTTEDNCRDEGGRVGPNAQGVTTCFVQVPTIYWPGSWGGIGDSGYGSGWSSGAGDSLKEAICGIPAVSGGFGIDAYAGIGASVSGSFNFDLARGRIGFSVAAGIGVGFGVNLGPQGGLSAAGGDMVSANLSTTVGGAGPLFPGANVGGAVTKNWLGTNPGEYAVAFGRTGTPSVFANAGGNASVMSPAAWGGYCDP